MRNTDDPSGEETMRDPLVRWSACTDSHRYSARLHKSGMWIPTRTITSTAGPTGAQQILVDDQSNRPILLPSQHDAIEEGIQSAAIDGRADGTVWMLAGWSRAT